MFGFFTHNPLWFLLCCQLLQQQQQQQLLFVVTCVEANQAAEGRHGNQMLLPVEERSGKQCSRAAAVCPDESADRSSFPSIVAPPSPPVAPPPPLWLLPPPVCLLRAEAGDDLRLLEDGLAGELLQHRHDHQAGGGGPGKPRPRDMSRDLCSDMCPSIVSMSNTHVCFDAGVLQL